MSLKAGIAKIWARQVAKRYAADGLNASAKQSKIFRYLLGQGRKTRFGFLHSFQMVSDYAQFAHAVPVLDYEGRKEFFERAMQGFPDHLWPGKPMYLAKTSGTTSGVKYIPITNVSIREQVKAARNALLLYIHETGKADFLKGKMLFLSGSPVLVKNKYGIATGRLSGIVNHFVPAYLQSNRIPSAKVNAIENWEEKVERILDEAIGVDLRLISGIPPWVQMFFERLHARTGKMPLEQWPNLQLYVSGGLDFTPYAAAFEKYFQGKVDLLETFPSSEGFFAFQDKHPDEGLLLNVNGGMFFEFITFESYFETNRVRLPLERVEIGRQYVLVVSSNAGLWAYDTGDLIKFVSLAPYRLKVIGRVKHFISAFGEHVIAEEVEKAMVMACEECNVLVNEFTVAPFVSDIKGGSFHQWFIEFEALPESLPHFSFCLDAALRKQNIYYDDLRKGALLAQARVQPLQLHATRLYMKAHGKLGGQNKFPRLANNREIATYLMAFLLEGHEFGA